MSTDAVPTPPPPPAATATNEDIEKNKVFGILAYLGILWLVPLLAAKDSPFAKFHTNEGLVLFLSGIVVWFGYIVLFWMSMLVAFLMPLVGLIGSILGLGFFILMILGIVNAANGQMKHLPLIGGRFTLIK